MICFDHFCRNYRHSLRSGGGIFLCHHKIRLAVRFFQQVRRNEQCKQLTVPHHFPDAFAEALSRCQEFIVPNGNVLKFGMGVDQLHQLVCIVPVLFAVAQKDVRIKRSADPFYRIMVN